MALLLMTVPTAALAQSEAEPTAISIGAPTAATLGDVVTLQARLVDSTGYPISKANVEFVAPLRFLDGQDDVVVASAITHQDGLAVATWRVRSTGDLTVKARFRGNQTYAASSASTALTTTGDQQLYTPAAGIKIPVLNEAPAWWPSGVWPLPSAWPVVLVLVMVWSLYGVAAAQLVRIARGGGGSRP
jgi:hypothetical protein